MYLVHFCLPKNEPASGVGEKSTSNSPGLRHCSPSAGKGELQKLASLKHAAILFPFSSSLLAQG
jgi:hypothetical protein